MSQKETQQKKTQQPLIDEEKDFYLSFINKKVRNIRKKLDQITELSKKEPNTLKPEQLEKINSKQEVLQSIKYYDDLKETYYAAYKATNEEARPAQKESSTEKSAQNQNQAETEESRKAYKEEIVRDTVKKVLDFISISQILGDSAKSQEFSKLYEAENKDLSHFTGIQDLHSTIFNFIKDSESARIEHRVEQSIDRLTKYVNAEEEVAVGEQTYKSVQENVERIANVPSFKNLTFSANIVQQVQPTTLTVEVQQESPVLVSNTAALLKPDIDDFVHSPEKGRFLPKEPKVVRFVDEIERDMQSAQTKQKDQETSSPSSATGAAQGAKESSEPLQAPQPENSNQEDPQEQKSFRRRTNNGNGSGYNKPRNDEYNNANGNGQAGKGGNNQKRYRNDGPRGYSKNGQESQGRGNGGKYQYKEYVQKKPSGDQY